MNEAKDRVPEGGDALDEASDAGSRWFVELDRGELDPARERELTAWLERDVEHDAELARCEAATQLARELQGDDELRWAFADAARLAETPPAPRALSWLRQPALAWGVAAIAVVVAVAVSWQRSPVPEVPAPPVSARSTVPAELVRDLASAKPVVLAPETANLVVEARSVAVLPFEREPLVPGGELADVESVAAELYVDVLRELAAIPGVYVLARSVVAPYAERAMAPGEIAMQLSVRAVVTARIAAVDGRARVVLTIVDAAQGAPQPEQVFDRPVAELTAMSTDIVTTIATTLAAPVGAREPVAPNEE